MKLAIGSDHAGFELKEKLVNYLHKQGHEVKDFGCHSKDSVDYPDFAHPLAGWVEKGEADMGLLMCGSGNGINMAANRHKGVRAALCWKKEIAQLAREHNDANVLTLPARYLNDNEAFEITDTFLSTTYEGGRHDKRVKKIEC